MYVLRQLVNMFINKLLCSVRSFAQVAQHKAPVLPLEGRTAIEKLAMTGLRQFRSFVFKVPAAA